jgi:hypothetical protein
MATNRLENILAQARALSPDELAQLIKQVSEMLSQSQSDKPDLTSYLSFFGAGRGTFATPDEVDRFLRSERDAWDE